MPSQLTGIIIVSNYKEKFTNKYKIVTGEAKGKGEETEEFFDFRYIVFQPISEESHFKHVPEIINENEIFFVTTSKFYIEDGIIYVIFDLLMQLIKLIINANYFLT